MGLFSKIKKGFKKIFKGVKKVIKKVVKGVKKVVKKISSSKILKALAIAAAVVVTGVLPLQHLEVGQWVQAPLVNG